MILKAGLDLWTGAHSIDHIIRCYRVMWLCVVVVVVYLLLCGHGEEGCVIF